MVVATSDGDRPSARTVLLKSVSAEGFVFFTNYDSRKGAEIAANPAVALHFGWYALQRQVRVEGTAERVSRAESEDVLPHPAARLPARRLGLGPVLARSPRWRSWRTAYAAAEQRFAGQDVPCPEHWGGYRVAPSRSSSGRASPAGCTTGCSTPRRTPAGR